MTITLPIPDAPAARLGDAGEVSRRALEAFVTAEYRTGRLTHFELRRLLGIATRHELDGFLKARGVNEGMTVEEFERDRETLDRLGL